MRAGVREGEVLDSPTEVTHFEFVFSDVSTVAGTARPKSARNGSLCLYRSEEAAMFQLMIFYLMHRNWRARLALNNSASSIFTCWLLAGSFVAASGIGYASKTMGGLESLGIFSVSIICVIISFAFLADAKRIHHIRLTAGNSVFQRDAGATG